MKPYFCSIHYFYFWRDVKNKKGNCSYCKLFNPDIHFLVNSQEYKEVNLDMAWKEEEGMSFVEWKDKNQEIVGKLVDTIRDFGENQSNVYKIEQENGEIIHIWGTGFLDTKMANVNVGDRIKIVYGGLGEPSKKGFNPPKLFKVFVDK